VRTIYWQTSSSAVAFSLCKSSASSTVFDLLWTLRCWERDNDIAVVCRLSSPLASNDNSLSFSSDEWAIDRGHLATVFAALQFFPDLDCFASRLNAICPIFFLLHPTIGSSGTDFFCQILPPVNLYMCPPVRLIPRIFRRMLSCPHRTFLLIVPDWPSAAFWVLLRFKVGVSSLDLVKDESIA